MSTKQYFWTELFLEFTMKNMPGVIEYRTTLNEIQWSQGCDVIGYYATHDPSYPLCFSNTK